MESYQLSVHSLNSIDDKGRLMLPLKLRADLTHENLILSRGIEDCLWLFPASAWHQFEQTLKPALTMFDHRSRLIQRRVLAPKIELIMDTTGRLKLPQSLMNVASIKRECYLIGMGSYIELWDPALYQNYEKQCSGQLEDAFNQLYANIKEPTDGL